MPKAFRRHRKMRIENIETRSSMIDTGCSPCEYQASRIEYRKQGQSLLEYIILVSIVAAVVVVMSPSIKRSVQAVVKVTADQLAAQNQADQRADATSSYLVNAFTSTRVTSNKWVQEVPGGITDYIYGDETNSTANSLTNLGFTNRRQ